MDVRSFSRSASVTRSPHGRQVPFRYEFAESGDSMGRILLREKVSAAHSPAANVACPLTQNTERSTDIRVPLVKWTALAPQREHWTLDHARGLSIHVIVGPVERGRCAVVLTDSVNAVRRAKRIHVCLAHIDGKDRGVRTPLAQRTLDDRLRCGSHESLR